MQQVWAVAVEIAERLRYDPVHFPRERGQKRAAMRRRQKGDAGDAVEKVALGLFLTLVDARRNDQLLDDQPPPLRLWQTKTMGASLRRKSRSIIRPSSAATADCEIAKPGFQRRGSEG